MKIRFVLLFLLMLPVLTQAASYENGKGYEEITPTKQPTVTSTDKIEVVEVFWYGCPHCYRFQPTIERWLKDKPDNVEYVRLPAILSKKWEIHARAYYTAEALGVLNKTHEAFFKAIHEQRNKLKTEQSLMAFYKEFGVSEEDFKKVFHSDIVKGKLQRARALGNLYKLKSTPSIVISGKYRLDPRMVKGGAREMIQVIDFLIQKESKISKPVSTQPDAKQSPS